MRTLIRRKDDNDKCVVIDNDGSVKKFKSCFHAMAYCFSSYTGYNIVEI